MSIEFKDIPDPSDGSLKAMVERRWTVIKFLATTSGLLRDPIVGLTMISSFARSGLIFFDQ